MKKTAFVKLITFLIGLIFLSLGVVLVIKSDLGVSVATSVPYIISLHFTKISFGQWNYIIHGLVLLLLILILRQIKVKYFASFIVAFLFGATIDMFTLLLENFAATSLMERLGVFSLGTIVISIGLGAFLKSDFPVLPFDTFVKEICIEKDINIAKFKTGFDLVCFSLSLILSFLFFKEIRGIHIGTFVSAVVTGSMVGKTLDILNKYIED